MRNIILISTMMILNLALTACGGKKQDSAVTTQQCILATGGSVDCAKAAALAETPSGQQALIAAAQKAGVDPALLETQGSGSSALIASQAAKVQSALAATEKDPASPYYRGTASVSASNAVDPSAAAISRASSVPTMQTASVPSEAAAPAASGGGSNSGAQAIR